MQWRNSEYAKRLIKRKLERLTALDVALYLYEYRTKKEDLDLFVDAKPYLTNGDGNPERWIARCVFQNAPCADSLETFIQLNYRENFHPTYWLRPDSTLNVIPVS